MATAELSDVYVNEPALLDVGAVSEKDASANTYDPNLGPRMNGPNVGGMAFTVSTVLTLALR
jgi:regulator of RNase E activity RraA